MLGAGLIVALWPIIIWYCQRTLDPSDSSWGILSLIALLWLAKGRMNEEGRGLGHVDYRLPTLALVIYLVSYPFVPPLVRAAFATVALVFLASQACFGQTVNLGVMSLGLLALPVVASLQFYLGYPLRVLVAKGAALLVEANGLAVHADGASLVWMNRLVMVDAPCSGISMLWVAMFLSSLLAVLCRFSNRHTLGFLSLALVATIVANIIRASALFFLEAGIIKGPPWAHPGVGVLVFLMLVCCLGICSMQIPPSSCRSSLPAERGRLPFLACSLIAAVVPFLGSATSVEELPEFPGWPTKFEGRALTQLELSREERAFYDAGFPGKIGRFSDGEREIVIRWVTKPTRKLHPSQDCFRGNGYSIRSNRLEPEWRVFRAVREDTDLTVKECITDFQDKRWTDLSAWYWDSVLGPYKGPFWSYVVAERTRPSEAR